MQRSPPVAAAIHKGDFLSLSGGQNFAEDVKSEVETLLSIGENADKERTLAAAGALTALGTGLATFASGKGLGALANLASGVVSFFTGSTNSRRPRSACDTFLDTVQ